MPMSDTLDRVARVLVVYYSATGHVHALAKGAEQVGADVRLRHVVSDRPRRPGVDDPGARQHLLPLGSDRAAARLHGPRSLRRRGQPIRRVIYERHPSGSARSRDMAVAVAQGRRLARVAQVIGLAQEQGLLDVRACVVAPQDGPEAGH